MKIILFAIFFFLSACTKNKPPLEVLLPTPTPTPAPTSSGMKNNWATYAEKIVKENFSKFDAAKDIKDWCPQYPKLSPDLKIKVWAAMVGAIIEHESDFNPNSKFLEKDGKWSIGLLQLSYGNRFCPAKKEDGNLEDPFVNLKCGVQLMAYFVEKDGVVAKGGFKSYGAPPPEGLARYWAVIRVPDSKSKHKKEIIRKNISSLPVCK